jgi:hypothetical protein
MSRFSRISPTEGGISFFPATAYVYIGSAGRKPSGISEKTRKTPVYRKKYEVVKTNFVY